MLRWLVTQTYLSTVYRVAAWLSAVAARLVARRGMGTTAPQIAFCPPQQIYLIFFTSFMNHVPPECRKWVKPKKFLLDTLAALFCTPI